ncbi:MAG: putative transport protein [Thermovirga sp.]|jgi:putative transport protein|nr:MAG: YidE/YbjL duplication [Thermovirga lienii]MDN5368366.1 putative transport protein [Thermovirga sp.]
MHVFANLLSNEIFVLVVTTAIGVLLGKVAVGKVSLGLSGCLFSGLIFGALGLQVGKTFFYWNLIIFVVSVGLLAAKDVIVFMKSYGLKFAILSVAVTGVGAASTWFFVHFAGGVVDPYVAAGTYVGALTSSPGLGAALESSAGNPGVVAGYTIAYPFGVLAVVLFVQLAPILLKIDIEKERADLEKMVNSLNDKRANDCSKVYSNVFSIASFLICIVVGMFVGSIFIPVPWIGKVSLGTTGGALLVSLIFGAFQRIGPLDMRMDRKILAILRDMSLAFFLTSAGLMAGPAIIEVFLERGFMLVGISTITALLSILIGYLLGRKLWKINWIILAGAICGAMTSTPGLGAAISATDSEDCAAGYGAAYPVALFCMVIFTTMIVKTVN